MHVGPSKTVGNAARTSANCLDEHSRNTMKNLLALFLGAGLAVATGCNKSSDSPAGSSSPGGGKKVIVAPMPKSKGNAYFVSCKQGADAAARELGLELIFDGPTDPDPAKQNEIIENWTAGAKTFKAGALGEFEIQGDNIVLGKPFIFNQGNIDQFDF